MPDSLPSTGDCRPSDLRRGGGEGGGRERGRGEGGGREGEGERDGEGERGIGDAKNRVNC